MTDARHYRPFAERGIVLVSSLLLLVVITIIAVSMFRSFGIQERIAGNMREKHRALQAAESAQAYAEWWLTTGGNASNSIVCAAGTLNANLNQGQICQNTLPSITNVTTVPWLSGAVAIGTDYTPPNMVVNTTAATGTYYAAPRFYISQLGLAATGQGNVYQIDAVGYGGTSDAVAVVESTYLVGTGVKDLGVP